jgi:hypothetical protein
MDRMPGIEMTKMEPTTHHGGCCRNDHLRSRPLTCLWSSSVGVRSGKRKHVQMAFIFVAINVDITLCDFVKAV